MGFGRFPDVADAASLAARVMQGDRAAESQLAVLYRESIFRYLRSRLRNVDVASGLVDDVLMATLLALRSGAVRRPDRIGAYMHGIAVHAVSGYLRGHFRQPALRGLDHDIADLSEGEKRDHDDKLRTVRTAMRQLGAVDKRILTLLLEEGFNETDVARRMGMNPAAVRQRKSRIVRKLAEVIKS